LFNGYGKTAVDIPPILKDVSVVLLKNVIVIQASQSSPLKENDIWKIFEDIVDPSYGVIFKKKSVEAGAHKSVNIVLRSPHEVPIANIFNIFENGLKFQLHLLEGLDFGIHLDMSEGRKWLKANAKGLRICNLFSYTCGLGVAALQGGCSVVENVDNSASALALGRVNAELNGFVVDNRRNRFTKRDVHEYIKQKLKKSKERFDLVVVDPSPPPNHLKTSEEKIGKFYLPLARKTSNLIVMGGRLLISCHPKDISEMDFVNSIINDDSVDKLALEEKIPYPPSMGIDRTKLFSFRKVTSE
jgi:23S rRNA G2069 N7-methylase RlmK/C1962 C5-methylase RlmI